MFVILLIFVFLITPGVDRAGMFANKPAECLTTDDPRDDLRLVLPSHRLSIPSDKARNVYLSAKCTARYCMSSVTYVVHSFFEGIQ